MLNLQFCRSNPNTNTFNTSDLNKGMSRMKALKVQHDLEKEAEHHCILLHRRQRGKNEAQNDLAITLCKK